MYSSDGELLRILDEIGCHLVENGLSRSNLGLPKQLSVLCHQWA